MAAAYLPHIGLLLGDHVLTADQGSYAITGQDASGGAAGVGTPASLPHLGLLGGLGGNAGVSEQGSYAVTGQDAAFLIGYRLACNVGFYTLSGQPALFSQSVNQGGNPAPLPHLGLMLASNSTSYTLTADPGFYGIFGSDGLADYEMSAASGTYSISGQDAGVSAVRFVTADQGTYAISGQDATFEIASPARTMAADFGTYSISGQDNAMSAGYGFSAEQGFYAVLGQTATLSVGQLTNYEMLAEHGDYQVFGIDQTLDVGDPVLWAEVGIYTIEGFPVVGGDTRPMVGGRPKRGKRKKHQLEIDGEIFDVDSKEEAEYMLRQLKEQAEETAKLAVNRAVKATKRPVRKILADARKTLTTPTVVTEDLQDPVNQVLAEIQDLYKSTLQTIEIAARLNRQTEEDEEEILLLLL